MLSSLISFIRTTAVLAWMQMVPVFAGAAFNWGFFDIGLVTLT
jgi:hypothetical protein